MAFRWSSERPSPTVRASEGRRSSAWRACLAWYRPLLEMLEERCLPATFTVNNTGDNVA